MPFVPLPWAEGVALPAGEVPNKAWPKAAAPPKAAASAPVASETSYDPMSKMVTLFKALDSSGDGMLQIEEFVDGLASLKKIHEIEILRKSKISERFKVLNLLMKNNHAEVFT